MFKRKNRGQSSLEYAILLILLMAAFLAAQNYVKRGVQGRWKDSVDQLGEQYDPRTADTDIIQTMSSSTNTSIVTMNSVSGWWTRRVDNSTSTETKKGHATVGAY